MPHDHSKKIAKFYWATPELVQKGITTAMAAKADWEKVPIDEKIQMFLKVSDQMADIYRADLNATTMLGQAKTIVQAEIDSACELIDFFRFNCFFAKELLNYQPISEDPNTTLNLLRYRALEGFIASVTPFNFTAIAGNLAYTPCVMGNVTLWKPSDTAILSNYLIYKIFRDAGFPDGVVNFLPSDGPVFGKTVTAHKDLAAVNFTGSVPTFQWLWKAVGQNLENFSGFPKLIGECGGRLRRALWKLRSHSRWDRLQKQIPSCLPSSTERPSTAFLATLSMPRTALTATLLLVVAMMTVLVILLSQQLSRQQLHRTGSSRRRSLDPWLLFMCILTRTVRAPWSPLSTTLLTPLPEPFIAMTKVLLTRLPRF